MPPPKKQTKKRTDIDSIEVPVWLKPGKAVWQETYDQSGNSVVGFSKLIVETMDEKTKKVRLMTEDNSPETEAYMDEVFDRAENPQIKDDLVDIDPLNDAELLRCLEIRFRKDLIYCFCGPTLLATNPYKIIKEAQSPDVLQMFQNYALKGGEKIKQPHIWNTASQVFLDLFSTQKKQAICISGESGAGKTVGTKLCLNFMATLVDAAKKDPSKEQPARGLLIGDKILSCNPILESFGNAKTVRNDNSSRFGKYFTISIDPSDKQIKGAEIKNYLLEKSRVVGQSKSERNYHIFYGILRFMPPDDIVKYKFNNDGNVAKASKYLYLNRSESEQSPIVGIDDKELFNDTSSSFPTFLFTSGEISAIWKTLSCVLNLGNIELNQKEVHGKLNCSLSDSQYLTNVIDLLQVKQQALSEGICMKKRDIQGHFILSARSPAQSESIKDALAKEMYNSLFIWIIKKLNFTLLPSIPHPGKQASFMTVGLLDIFGFEDFDSNSLEQFCINYTNEKLQNLYISYVFKAERLLFEQEGLGNYAYMIKFEDNIPIIELIDKKPLGIFYLLNSVAKTAKDDGKDDEKLMDQIQKNHSNSSYLSYDKLKQDIFAVRHVAKKVIYTSGGFVEKNKDELPMNLLEVIDTADKYMVRIFRKVLIEKEDVVSKSTDPDDKFLTHKFRNEMQSLMEELESSNCSFIRCLKPNEVGQSDYWVSSLVLNQIRYLGVLDSIKIRREAVPIRKSYKEFYSQFHDLDLVSPERLVPFITIKDKNLDWKVLSKNLMISVSKEVQPNDAIFGNNKIFMGIKFVHFLEKQLDVALKAKRIASEKIAKSFVIYRITNEWNKLRRKISLSIKMSKVILINWNSKISYVKLKKLISIVTRMQRQFRMTLYKRGIRIQKFSTMVIGRSFRLFQIKKVLFKVNLLQRLMVNLKQRMAHKRAIFRLRVCKKLTEELYESTWKAVERKHQAVASITIQRIFRGYLSSVEYT